MRRVEDEEEICQHQIFRAADGDALLTSTTAPRYLSTEVEAEVEGCAGVEAVATDML